MSKESSPTVHKVSEHGAVGTHPVVETETFLVAPTTADKFNTFGLDLVPVACLSLTDILFEFDSSFVTGDATKILRHLPQLRDRHKNSKGDLPPLSVFGHADPVGDIRYNKQLSGRRAKAVYGVLTHDVNIWLRLMNNPFGGDNWQQKRLLDRMRASIGDSTNRPAAAVIADYQKMLCPTAVLKKDFLGKGIDPGGAADFQSCGEFNPLIILSKTDEKTLTTTDRDEANQPNRRVVVFLFRVGTKVSPALWPCPRADEGTTKCTTRFFADSKRRLAPGENRREHKEPQPNDPDPTVAEDTFACRFYDRIARLSPCERILRNFQLKLFDEQARPLPFAPFVVLHGAISVGRANEDAVLTLPALTVPETCTVKWSRPQPGDNQDSPEPDPNASFDFQLQVFVGIPQERNEDEIALQRLHNLGYAAGPTPDHDIADFQNDYRSRLPAETLKNQLGKLDGPTKDVLRDVYNAADPLVKSVDSE